MEYIAPEAIFENYPSAKIEGFIKATTTKGYKYLSALLGGLGDFPSGMTCQQIGINSNTKPYAVKYVEENRACGQPKGLPVSIDQEPVINPVIKTALQGDGDLPAVCILPESKGGCHYSLGSRAVDANITQCPLLALRLKKLIAERNNQPQQKDLHDGGALQVQANSESNNTPGAIDFDPFEYHRIEVAGSDPTTVLIQVLMQQVGVICFSPRIARTHRDKELFSTLALMEGVDRKGLVRTIKTISVTPEQAREIVRMKKILRSAGQTITPRETEIELREQLLWHLYGLANMDVVDTTISLGDLRKAYEVYGSEFPGTVISNVASTAGCIISDEIGVQQKIDFSTMKKIHKPGMGTNSSPFCGKCRLARTTKGSYNTICPIIRPEAEQPR